MPEYERTREVRHTVGERGEVVLRTIAASVRVRGIDGDEAHVVLRYALRSPDEAAARRVEDAFDAKVLREDGRLEAGSGEGPVSIDLPGAMAAGTLASIARAFGLGTDARLELEAALPRAAALTLETVSGRVSVTGMSGVQRLRTVSGDLALVGAGGDIRIDTTSGDMSVDSAADVRLDWHSLSGDLRAAATLFRAVRLDSLSGDAWLEGALAPADEHRVRSVSGGLRIAPVGGLVADVWSISGSVRSELPHRLDGAPGRRVLVIGDGGPRLRFESMSGRLHVTRPRDRDHVPAGAGPERDDQARGGSASAESSAGGPTGPDGGTGSPAQDHAFGNPVRDGRPAPDRPSIEVDQLEVLRAVERGDIDVEEAMRRLRVTSHA